MSGCGPGIEHCPHLAGDRRENAPSAYASGALWACGGSARGGCVRAALLARGGFHAIPIGDDSGFIRRLSQIGFIGIDHVCHPTKCRFQIRVANSGRDFGLDFVQHFPRIAVAHDQCGNVAIGTANRCVINPGSVADCRCAQSYSQCKCFNFPHSVPRCMCGHSLRCSLFVLFFGCGNRRGFKICRPIGHDFTTRLKKVRTEIRPFGLVFQFVR